MCLSRFRTVRPTVASATHNNHSDHFSAALSTEKHVPSSSFFAEDHTKKPHQSELPFGRKASQPTSKTLPNKTKKQPHTNTMAHFSTSRIAAFGLLLLAICLMLQTTGAASISSRQKVSTPPLSPLNQCACHRNKNCNCNNTNKQKTTNTRVQFLCS